MKAANYNRISGIKGALKKHGYLNDKQLCSMTDTQIIEYQELVKNKKYWLPVSEEMLKYLEFSKKDYKKCLELIDSTMTNLSVLAEIDPYSEYYDWLAKFQKRKRRIENKKVLRSE